MYDFMTDKALDRNGHKEDSWLFAEGIIDGKVVATHRVFPARRPAQIRLSLDNEGLPLVADGSDFVTVVASMTDSEGNVKRLNNQTLRFTVEGEGHIIGDTVMGVNPMPLTWGTAPVLVRSTLIPGKIRIRATTVKEGLQTPLAGELVIESVAPYMPQVYSVQKQLRCRPQRRFP